MDILLSIAESPLFLLGLVALAAAILLLVLAVRLRSARAAASFVDLDATLLRIPGTDGEAAVHRLDLRRARGRASVAEAFRTVLALIAEVLPGRASRYRLPWFLGLGAARAGMSTLLANTALKLPFGGPDELLSEGPSSCRFWLFDRALVLDLDGELVLRLDGTSSDEPAYRSLLERILRERSRRPADGVVLAIGAGELFGYRPGDGAARAALGQHAAALRSKLDEQTRRFGFRLPVSVVVTQCDRVPGMADLLAALEPGERQQMLGWTNPLPPETPYAATWVDDTLESVAAGLERFTLRVVFHRRPLAEPRSFLSLPARFLAVREALQIYLNRLFGDTSGPPAPPLSGVYFTAGEGFSTPPPGSPHEPVGEEAAPPIPPAHRRVWLVADFFSRVVSDWALARPTEEARRRRGRVLAATRALLALAVLIGPAFLVWGHRQLARAVNNLERELLTPAERVLQPGYGTRPADAVELLRAADEVRDYRLRQAFLPASWWSSYGTQVERVTTAAYERAVFPQTLARLEGGVAAAVASRPPSSASPGGDPLAPAGRRSPIYDVTSVPAFGDLQTLTGRLATLEGSIELYDRFARDPCFASGGSLVATFDRLTSAKAVWGLSFAPQGLFARDFWGDVLCRARISPTFDHRRFRGAAEARQKALSDQLATSLFERNALVVDLLDLERQVGTLARQAPPPEEAVAIYRTLDETFERTDADLARQELAWTAGPKLDLGPAWQAESDAIARSPFLGVEDAKALDAEMGRRFRRLRSFLQDASTPATGPLLARKGDAYTLALSPEAEGLHVAVGGLLQRLAPPGESEGITVEPPAGTYLTWDASGLKRAVAELSGFEAFLAQDFKDFPGFRQMAQAATRRGVEEDALGRVAAAQRFPAVPDLGSSELREAHLAGQVADLQAAAEPLNQLLGSLTKPPAVAGCSPAADLPYCRLAEALLVQRRNLLDELDRLLAGRGLYLPAPPGFTAWNGDDNPAWSAYGVTDKAGLTAYVNGQRGIVQTLADSYATPILSAVPLRDPQGIASRTAAAERWSLIVSDLADYKDKKPDNALGLLESFLVDKLPGLGLASCLEVVPPEEACFASSAPEDLTLDPPPCDFFLATRRHLELGFGDRCQKLTASAGTAAYAEIAAGFDQRLAGRYPFSAGSAPGAGEATPEDLAAFFELYDRDRPATQRLERVLARPRDALPTPPPRPWTTPSQASISTFLARLDRVRTFFAPFLTRVAAAKGKVGGDAVPVYDLAVELRPFPGLETGGDQIIDRALTVGTTTVELAPPPTTGDTPPPPPRWTWGTAVTLTLRWAKDGPIVPRGPAGSGDAYVEGRSATWAPAGPWSLLHLLTAHPAAADQPTGTLAFSVGTARGAAPDRGGRRRRADAEPAATKATVFVRITPLTPDESATPLSLPDFPTAAPAPVATPPASRGNRSRGASGRP